MARNLNALEMMLKYCMLLAKLNDPVCDLLIETNCHWCCDNSNGLIVKNSYMCSSVTERE